MFCNKQILNVKKKCRNFILKFDKYHFSKISNLHFFIDFNTLTASYNMITI